MPGRTLAIGDIHGCSAALDGLLALLRPQPDDTIVTLGDYADRGPDSRGVFDRLIELAARCRLIPILGNHDQVLLDVLSGEEDLDWFLDIGGDATLDSYGPGRDPSLIPADHVAFLESCLDFHETATHIFLHANYDAELPMAEQPVDMLRWESLRAMTPGPHASGKTVVVGHSSQKKGKVLDLGHLVCIDTYCFGGGRLTALDVATGDTWQVDRDGRPRR